MLYTFFILCIYVLVQIDTCHRRTASFIDVATVRNTFRLANAWVCHSARLLRSSSLKVYRKKRKSDVQQARSCGENRQLNSTHEDLLDRAPKDTQLRRTAWSVFHIAALTPRASFP